MLPMVAVMAHIDDGFRRWVAFNIVDDIAAEHGASSKLLNQKPASRPERMAQAYAAAPFLRELRASEKAVLHCLDRYFFPPLTPDDKRRRKRKPENGDEHGGASKAINGPRSKIETARGKIIVGWIREDKARHDAHLIDLQRIFARELSEYLDIDSG